MIGSPDNAARYIAGNTDPLHGERRVKQRRDPQPSKMEVFLRRHSIDRRVSPAALSLQEQAANQRRIIEGGKP